MLNPFKRDWLSFGSKVLLLYLTVYYFIPFIVIHVTGFQSLYYKYPSLTAVQWLYALMIWATVLIIVFAKLPSQEIPKPVALNPPPFILQLGLLIAMDAVAGLGFWNGSSGWRYSEVGLSDNLNATSLFYVLAQQIFEFLVFLEIFFFAKGDATHQRQRRLIILLLVFGLFLVASGLGPMLTAMIVFLYLIFPRQFHLLMFRENVNDQKDKVSVKMGLIPMVGFGAILVVIGLVLGEQVKSGVDSTHATDNLLATNNGDYVGYLIDRFSTAEYSIHVAISEYTTPYWDKVTENIWAPVGNFIFRLDALTGGVFGMVRPYGGSLMRLNYELINYYPDNPKEGTAPGLIGGFLMCFPMPFSLIVLGMYVAFVRYILNIMRRGLIAYPNFIGICVALYFLSPLFSSPVDFLLILDNGVASLLFFVGLAAAIQAKARKGDGYASY